MIDKARIVPDPSIDMTLQERHINYGSFSTQALISQRLKIDVAKAPGWQRLVSDQREGIEMILHKIARIVNGNPDFADSWHDIAGYARLVEKRLNNRKVERDNA